MSKCSASIISISNAMMGNHRNIINAGIFISVAFSSLSIWAMAPELVFSQQPILNPQLQWSRGISANIQAKPTNYFRSVDFLSFPRMAVESGLKLSPLPIQQSEKRKWTIQTQDKTLYRTMRRWAQEAEYQLLWQVDKDFPIEANVEFNSTLREALEQVMAGVALTDYPIQAVYNPTAKVLRVVRYLDDGRR